MKIMLIIPSLTQGGAEKNFLQLANSLNEKHNLSFVTLTNKKNLQSIRLNKNINLKNLNKDNAKKSFYQLRRLIKKESPDLIISTIINASFITALVLKSFKNSTKHIVRISNDINYIKKSSFVNNIMFNFVSKFSNKIILLSDQNIELVKSRYPAIYKKCQKIENPIFSNNNVDISSSNKIICITRMEKHKNNEFLIDNIISISQSFQVSIDLYGDGSDLKMLIKKYKNYEFVNFYGFVPLENIKISDYKIFINCSKFEGSPNSTIEAITSGLLVLIADNLKYTLPSSIQNLSTTYGRDNSESFQENLITLLEQTSNLEIEVSPTLDKNINLWESVIHEVN